jgi:hypothetical protein
LRDLGDLSFTNLHKLWLSYHLIRTHAFEIRQSALTTKPS